MIKSKAQKVDPEDTLNQKNEPLDNIINKIIENHKILLKSGPASIGFLIFLIYFFQNKFFPSFDVFSLASLLISAFAIGGFLYLAITFGIAAPSYFWVSTFFLDEGVKEDLSYYLRNAKEKTQNTVKILIKYYFLPILICSLADILALTKDLDSTDRDLIKISLAIFTSTLISYDFYNKFKTTKTTLFKFILISSFSYILASLICLFFTIFMLEAHAKGIDESSQIAVAVFSSIIGSMVVSCIAIGSLQNYKYTIFFSAILTLFITIITNFWIELPNVVMKNLGIGNYTAEKINLTNDYCKNSKPSNETKEGECQLNKVHVIWSIGEIYNIKLSSGEKMKIPSKYVVSIQEPHRKN